MTAVEKLLDKAAKTCSPANYSGLAARLGLSRSVISGWKNGTFPIPAERIAEIARIAHMDPGEWVLLIEAEQSRGEARKAYAALVQRLGIAAALALCALPGVGWTGDGVTSHITAQSAYYVRRWRRFVHGLRLMLARRTDARYALLSL